MADSTEQDGQDPQAVDAEVPARPEAADEETLPESGTVHAAEPGLADDAEVPPAVDEGDEEGALEAGDGQDTVDDPAADAEVEPVTEEDLRRPIGELKAIVEAMIFASPEPLTPKALFKLLDNEPKEDILQALEELKVDYLRPGGLQLVEVAGGFQIVTRSDLHEWVRRLFHERSAQKLSVQALESLAVIAYRQPITALEITEIRGVSASGVLNTLLERHLIKIVGRKQVVGRPFMYATTKEFLIRFGLKDLSDLPKVEDMAESLGIESNLLVEQTPPEEQLPLSEPDYAAIAAEEADAIEEERRQAAAAEADADAADDDPEPVQ
ncbi:MAG: SMC-Scp complex subunit ScpB [Vicinamibacterales bacterium]